MSTTYTSLFQLASEAALLPDRACLWCVFFKTVDLRRDVRTFCMFSGERTTPNGVCEFFQEARP